MLARTLWLMHTIEFGAYVLLLGFLDVPAGLIVILALGLYIVIHALVLALTFIIAIIFRSQPPKTLRISPFNATKVFFFELVAWLLLYLVLFPLEPWLDKKTLEDEETEEIFPVLLIHGFLCNAGFWWPIKRHLRRSGVTNLYALNLEPLLGDIDALADQIAEQVDTILRATGKRQLILVTHSMGGLAARAYIRRYHAHEKIAKLVTLGTPHHGTKLAWFMLGANVRQMRPGSSWLKRLNADKPQSESLPVTSIYSSYDNIVAPQDSSVLIPARNLPLGGPGHLSMAFSQPIQRLVYDEIRDTAKQISDTSESAELMPA